jgi:phytol kinase
MNVAAAALALAMVPASVEALSRRRSLDPERLRKVVHVGAAPIVAALPLFVSYGEIAALGLLFAFVMAVSRRLGIFRAVHGVGRETHGEILYPLGLAAAALLFPDGTAFVYAVLVVGLADGLAAPVGQRYGRRRLPGGKSVWGSTTFFAISLAVGASVLLAGGAKPLYALAAAATSAAALTATEAFLSGGLDNAVLPPLAGALISVAA